MKCKCKDCRRVIRQEDLEPIMVVNSKDNKHIFALCETCFGKRGKSIVKCAHCAELTEKKHLSVLPGRIGFTPCPVCDRDVYTGKTAEEYAPVVCKRCGGVIHNPDEDARVINEDTNREYALCESCFDTVWNLHQIIRCAGCGQWYDHGTLHTDRQANFTPCPTCGLDVMDGQSREERTAMLIERRVPETIPEEMATAIIAENQRLAQENNDLRLQIAVLNAKIEAMPPTADKSKYRFLSSIQLNNETYDKHIASGFVTTLERIDDWPQKLAEFEMRKGNGHG